MNITSKSNDFSRFDARKSHNTKEIVVSAQSQKIIDACKTQNLSMLKTYYEQGVDFNKIYDTYGDTLLHIAINYDKTESFKALLSYGVNIENTSKYDGTTALNYAVMSNKPYYVQQLIDLNANINTRDDDGFTPLNNAAYFERYEILKTLLKHPLIDVNTPSDSTASPLYFAFMDGRMDVVEQIVKHPSFDVEFALILENDAETYELKDYLHSLPNALNNDFELLDLYQQVKLFALKYDFDGCLPFSQLKDHGFNCFDLSGYANREGTQGVAYAFDNFYENIVRPSSLPIWAQQAFVGIKESLQFSASIFEPAAYLNKIKLGETVIIPSGWDGHSITFVIQDDKLYRCNRGHLSDGIHGIEEFLITKPENITVDLIGKMLAAEGEPYYFQYGLVNTLGLEKIGVVENPTQIVGNCVWTSLETGVEASLINNFLEQGLNTTEAHSLAKDTFLLWEEFDLNFTMKEVVKNPSLFSENKVLDDLLIHALDNFHDPESITDVQRGVVALEHLEDPLVFETFDKLFGQDLIKYDPLSYSSISYMKPYTPTEQGYLNYLTNWFSSPISSSSSNPAMKEFETFLKACDKYRQEHADNLLDITDILDVSNTKALEALFNKFSDNFSEVKQDIIQGELPILPVMPMILTTEEQVVFVA